MVPKNVLARPRRRGLIRVTNDGSNPLAEVRDLISSVRNELNQRDLAMKKMVEDAQTQLKEQGQINNGLKEQLEAHVKASAEMQGRLVGLEQALTTIKNVGNREERRSLGRLVIENDDVKNYLKQGIGARGHVRMEVKNAIQEFVSGGSGTGANEIIVPQRIPGWVAPPNRTLRVRNLLNAGRTTSNAVDFVQETGFANNAAAVAEGETKPESHLEFTLHTAPVRTIAHWIQASKQVLEDIPQLEGYIDTRLRYGLGLVEEEQLLSGDGTGHNLLGLIPQATPFDVSRRHTGDTRMDIIRRAMTQLRISEYQPDAIVLHPTDWEDIELTKNSFGQYLRANPGTLLPPTLWGLPVLDSTSLAPGEFMVGAFGMAAQIWDRDDATVEISTEDRDNFIKNMVTIRAEMRLALVVYRPESFIFGDFTDVVSGE